VTESANKKPSGNEIREKFLQFFERRGTARAFVFACAPWRSDAAVYERGMNQFKDVSWAGETGVHAGDDGAEMRARRGQHNDWRVWFTKRHHTFLR